MHVGKKHLNQKFPKCPAASCTRCGNQIRQVSVIKKETVGQNWTLTCQANCPKCGQKHMGHRVIGVTGKHMRFRSQSFDPIPTLPKFVIPGAAAVVGAGLVAWGMWFF